MKGVAVTDSEQDERKLEQAGRPAGRVKLHVCVTCRGAAAYGPDGALRDPGAGEPRPGARLHAAIAEAGLPEGVELVPVECLSACVNGCSIAISGPGRWGYVYGRLDPENHVADIVAGVTAYAASTDGLVPWRERPTIFRKQSIARIPPQEH
ncbi:MAG: DUF1636 domain-containing protein [Rhizobiales bacterium]|nr:DUF1636 domain-containing protein [Hyphomicrobiales bacterium]